MLALERNILTMLRAKPRAVRRSIEARAGKITDKHRSRSRLYLGQDHRCRAGLPGGELDVQTGEIEGRWISRLPGVEAWVVGQENRAAVDRRSPRALALSGPDVRRQVQLDVDHVA